MPCLPGHPDPNSKVVASNGHCCLSKFSQRRKSQMCDYSLMAVPNRLAAEGEDLIAHRFPTGSMGLASPVELKQLCDHMKAQRGGIWTKLKNFVSPPVWHPGAA